LQRRFDFDAMFGIAPFSSTAGDGVESEILFQPGCRDLVK
jgi:hypothetical protein